MTLKLQILVSLIVLREFLYFSSGTTYFFFWIFAFFNFFLSFSCITFWKIVARATRDVVQGQKRGEKEVPKVIVYICLCTTWTTLPVALATNFQYVILEKVPR